METITVEGFIQLVTSGGLGALTWYLVIYALPKMQDKHDATIKEVQKEFLIQQKEFVAQLKEMQKTFSDHNDKKDALFRDAMNQMTSELIRALKGHNA